MKWLGILCLGLNVSMAAAPQLLFSVGKQQELKSQKISSSLVVMSDGSYSFDSSSGSWGNCNQRPAGSFQGKLKPQQLKQLQADFEVLAKECAAIEGCGEKSEANAAALWRVTGWGKNQGKNFIIKEQDHLPSIIGHLLTQDYDLWQSPKTSLQLAARKVGKELTLELTYQGEEPHYKLVDAADAFLWISRKGEARLPSKRPAVVRTVHSKQVLKLVYPLGEEVQAGDQLVYIPGSAGPNPCAVVR